MLDFSRVETPADHGQVLVMPSPCECRTKVDHNARHFNRSTALIAGQPLSEWRRRTRSAMGLDPASPLLVLGHQPEWIHPGVWAKHVVGMRLAQACGGNVVNLVVDSDVPRQTAMACPVFDGSRLSLNMLRFPPRRGGLAYEQLTAWSQTELDSFGVQLRNVLAERYAESQMPTFLAGVASYTSTTQRRTQVSEENGAFDVADQFVAGRKSIESQFGVSVNDHRVSRVWWTPLLVDIILDAGRFAAAYNDSLAEYRRRFRVRGEGRPIPSLAVSEDRIELPVWAFRRGEPRRRLFVTCRGDGVRFDANSEPMGDSSRHDLLAWLDAAPSGLRLHGWALRPRALLLTAWARLVLADMFIHGIGGAKYDRITDELIRKYWGLGPPDYACVSATLHLNLPCESGLEFSEDQLRDRLRDLMWNPQRHLADEPAAAVRIAARESAIGHATALRQSAPGDHAARAAAFRDIRRETEELRRFSAAPIAEIGKQIELAAVAERNRRIARGREYFLGLYDKASLLLLLDVLPASVEFKV